MLGVVQNQAKSNGRIDPVSSFVSGALMPVTALFDRWGDSSTEFFGGVRDARALRIENRRLRAEMAAVANYAASQDRMMAEIDRLRKLVNLDPRGKTKLYADIVAISPLDNQFTIGVGLDQGVKAGQPVVGADGLLGIVSAVDKRQARVVMLGAPSVIVSGLIQGDQLSSGMIRGSIGERLIMTLLESQSVKPGAEVMTTGYSSYIPRGIPIGVVLEVNKDEQSGQPRAQILAHAKLSASQEVAVLK